VQGSHAVEHILDPNVAPHQLEMIPSGIYTIPEISSIGRSERELQEAKVPYEVGHCAFKNLARAQMTEEKVGMLKIIFHAENHGGARRALFRRRRLRDRAHRPDRDGEQDINDIRYFTAARRSTIRRWPRRIASRRTTASTRLT
jgi:NAD(P) transhydrogenase